MKTEYDLHLVYHSETSWLNHSIPTKPTISFVVVYLKRNKIRKWYYGIKVELSSSTNFLNSTLLKWETSQMQIVYAIWIALFFFCWGGEVNWGIVQWLCMIDALKNRSFLSCNNMRGLQFVNKKNVARIIEQNLLFSNKLASFKGTCTWENLLKKKFCDLRVDVSNIAALGNITI